MNLGDDVLAHALELQGIDSSGPYDLEMLLQIVDVLLHVLSEHVIPPVFLPESVFGNSFINNGTFQQYACHGYLSHGLRH
ncbi:hypothetical protein, partial [Desulfovibrio sp.]|uniref:hypothetical protein n=1 Tax=Desulfovibrio sp. TaxID=885 RepID=UPI00257D4424